MAGLVASTVTGSDLMGWIAAGLAVVVMLSYHRWRRLPTTCSIAPSTAVPATFAPATVAATSTVPAAEQADDPTR